MLSSRHLHVDERRRAAIESPPFFILPPLARRCLLPRERKTSVTSAHVSWAELPFDVGDAKGLVGAEMKTDPKENETRAGSNSESLLLNPRKLPGEWTGRKT